MPFATSALGSTVPKSGNASSVGRGGRIAVAFRRNTLHDIAGLCWRRNKKQEIASDLYCNNEQQSTENRAGNLVPFKGIHKVRLRISGAKNGRLQGTATTAFWRFAVPPRNRRDITRQSLCVIAAKRRISIGEYGRKPHELHCHHSRAHGCDKASRQTAGGYCGHPDGCSRLAKRYGAATGPVAVAAGDAEIVSVVERHGGTAVLTDPSLPSGTDRVFAAVEILDPAGGHELVVNLQGDLPLLDPVQLRIVKETLETSGADIATLAAPITDAADFDNPNVVKPSSPGRTMPLTAARFISPANARRSATGLIIITSASMPFAARRWRVL